MRFYVFLLGMLLAGCAGQASEAPTEEQGPSEVAFAVSCDDGSAPGVTEGAEFCSCASGLTQIAGLRDRQFLCPSTSAAFTFDGAETKVDAGGCVQIVTASPDVTLASDGPVCFYPQ